MMSIPARSMSWIGAALTVRVTGIRLPAMDRITFNPNQCGGRPCIRGMRISVKDVLYLLAAGVSEAEVLADFPYLEKEDIRACLAFAASEADHPILVAADR
jgi:uncharacterized protein (DUF433 family)